MEFPASSLFGFGKPEGEKQVIERESCVSVLVSFCCSNKYPPFVTADDWFSCLGSVQPWLCSTWVSEPTRPWIWADRRAQIRVKLFSQQSTRVGKTFPNLVHIFKILLGFYTHHTHSQSVGQINMATSQSQQTQKSILHIEKERKQGKNWEKVNDGQQTMQSVNLSQPHAALKI